MAFLQAFCLIALLFRFSDVTASHSHHDDYSFNIDRVARALKVENSLPSRYSQDNIILRRKILQEYGHELRHAFLSEAQQFVIENRTRGLVMPSSINLIPDAKRDVGQLISSKGYPVEKHTVQTQDGFLLTVHRIPYGRNGKKRFQSKNDDDVTYKNQSRPVVFLQHGLVSSAADWVMNSADDSLGFLLADNGYDVWMGNSRGNTYSMGHVSLKPDDPKFWDWTFDEMIKYDIPACMDYVLNKTGQPSLYYVGHSQGTIIAFAAFSSFPEYQKKIRLFVGMAPIITLDHIISPVKYLSPLSAEQIYFLFGRKSFFENNLVIKFLVDELCPKSATRWVCSNIVFLICGYDTANLNKTRVPVYLNHTPAGTSVKNMIHYAQFVREKTFSMFDYGSSRENLNHYNQTRPPLYHPRNFNVPALLYTATKDWLADPKDVLILESTIPNIVGKHNYPEWNHLDFVWGMDAVDKCYNNLLEYLPKY